MRLISRATGSRFCSHAGNGALFFYAGDRVTLTSAVHEVSDSTVSYSNRYMYCYVPMVSVSSTEVVAL